MDVRLGLNIFIKESEEILIKNTNENIKITKKKYEKMTLFTIENKKYNQDDFYNDVSDRILNIIIENYSVKFLEEKIYNDKNIDLEYREELYIKSKNTILEPENFILEKEYIREEIIRYMNEYPIIYLDGFILFRLKNLSNLINIAIDQTMENIIKEKEYENFMEVLEYIADSKDPDLETIRVRFTEDDYILMDDKFLEIDKEYFKRIAKKIDSKDINNEDLLISTLLALGPNKVLIEINEYNKKSTMELIERIFLNKVYYCYNCGECIRRVGLKKKRLNFR